MKVLVADKILDEGIRILQTEPGIEVDVKTSLTEDELLRIIPDYDALIVRSRTKVDEKLIGKTTRLKLIGRAGSGLDNVDVDCATRKGIAVMNTPLGNTLAVAEYTIALLLSLCRHVPTAHIALKDGEWDRSRFMGIQLHDKTLGILGLGRIGKEVAIKCKAFGMQVIAFDPFINVEQAEKLGVKLVDFEGLLADADFITIHAPLTDQTRRLISSEEIKRMKDGVRIINCARGGICDEEALYEALQSGKIAGAAMDVFEKEPPLDSRLLKLDNVIVTPHIGAHTREAQKDVSVQIARQIIDALKGRGFDNVVNIPIMGEEYKNAKAFLQLAEKIGALHIQLTDGRLKEVAVECMGEASELVKPLVIATLKGMLQPILKENVNYVNALYIANERGIRVLQSQNADARNYANLIEVTAQTEEGAKTIAGTLFNYNHPRIVKIDDFRIDANPSGVLLILSNMDVPGVVGKIGTLLGDNNINIAEWRLGRTEKENEALSVINLDSKAPMNVMNALKSFQEVIEVKQVIL